MRSIKDVANGITTEPTTEELPYEQSEDVVTAYKEWRKTKQGSLVYKLFEAEAAAWIERKPGQRTSANYLRERVRWEHDLDFGTGDYKLPNEFTPGLAVEYVLRHPEHEHLFEIRRATNPWWLKAKRPATGGEVAAQVATSPRTAENEPEINIVGYQPEATVRITGDPEDDTDELFVAPPPQEVLDQLPDWARHLVTEAAKPYGQRQRETWERAARQAPQGVVGKQLNAVHPTELMRKGRPYWAGVDPRPLSDYELAIAKHLAENPQDAAALETF